MRQPKPTSSVLTRRLQELDNKVYKYGGLAWVLNVGFTIVGAILDFDRDGELFQYNRPLYLLIPVGLTVYYVISGVRNQIILDFDEENKDT